MRKNFPGTPLHISLSFYWSLSGHMLKHGLGLTRAIFSLDQSHPFLELRSVSPEVLDTIGEKRVYELNWDSLRKEER